MDEKCNYYINHYRRHQLLVTQLIVAKKSLKNKLFCLIKKCSRTHWTKFWDTCLFFLYTICFSVVRIKFQVPKGWHSPCKSKYGALTINVIALSQFKWINSFIVSKLIFQRNIENYRNSGSLEISRIDLNAFSLKKQEDIEKRIIKNSMKSSINFEQ